MALTVVITSGPRKGSNFMATPGLRIGRKKGDVLIEDPKMSGLHAHIEQGAGGILRLIDNKSSNDIRVNGRKVPSLILSAGTEFQLGETHFRISEELAETLVTDASPAGAPSGAPSRAPSSPEPARESPKSWADTLASWLRENSSELLDEPIPISAFGQLVDLEFVRGPQFATKWTVGFGPRKFGADSLEFPLVEATEPNHSFELIPSGRGVIFRTNDSAKILLNGKEVFQQFIKHGDLVEIGTTHIQVSFRK